MNAKSFKIETRRKKLWNASLNTILAVNLTVCAVCSSIFVWRHFFFRFSFFAWHQHLSWSDFPLSYICLLSSFAFHFVLFYSIFLFCSYYHIAVLCWTFYARLALFLPCPLTKIQQQIILFLLQYVYKKIRKVLQKQTKVWNIFFFFANAFHLDKSIEMELFVLKCEKSLKIRAATSAGCVIVSLSLAAFSVIFLKKFGIELGQFPSIEFKFQFSIFYASHMHNNAAENYQMQQQQHLHQPQQLNWHKRNYFVERLSYATTTM